MRILVTGAAGFIGFHVANRLLTDGHEVVGLDSVNHYYDVRLKEARLALLQQQRNFELVRTALADPEAMNQLFDRCDFQRVVHLAAQAGVRYSLERPDAYIASNILGFLQVLEECRYRQIPHLVYASSSSVYGANTQMPFSVHRGADHPLSMYGVTKRSNELMAHSYSYLFRLPTTGLRLFTVYGPWGRPDMVLFKFTKAILDGRPIDVFNNGHMKRDFTYVDDVVESVVRIMDVIPTADTEWSSDRPDPSSSSAPFRLYNVGNHEPVDLLEVIALLEEVLGRKAHKNLLPMQPGDVAATYADVESLHRTTGFSPQTSMREGVQRFVEWYKAFYGVT
ncbi:MAG: NAD-dependent epimerase [Candidatus Eisenbacteria bacterium]|uniref:NAD-dependent epimerase n=1 Tax=Eiseniibacteriota bacterium TaxID=2212470 RepID=A0A538SG97_UNCEI|nr:MAG: NAD-dependent epimerase [Candidatus Eisenbacteria bacterium]